MWNKNKRYDIKDYKMVAEELRRTLIQTNSEDWISLSDLLEHAIENIEIIERYEKGREFIVAADSELSAIAHGRPQSEKAELIRISSGLRDIYDRR